MTGSTENRFDCSLARQRANCAKGKSSPSQNLRWLPSQIEGIAWSCVFGCMRVQQRASFDAHGSGSCATKFNLWALPLNSTVLLVRSMGDLTHVCESLQTSPQRCTGKARKLCMTVH